jgi:hypothetical protein
MSQSTDRTSHWSARLTYGQAHYDESLSADHGGLGNRPSRRHLQGVS